MSLERVAACAVSILLLLGGTRPARAAGPEKRLLILSADSHASPGLLDMELGLRGVIDEAMPTAEIQVEHLDLVYNSAPEARRTLVDFLRVKYSGREPHVVMAIGASALRFILAEKEQIFPHASILFSHVTPQDLSAIPLRKDLAGIVTDWHHDKQIDTALRLLPRTKRAIVIIGSGPAERSYEARWRRDFDRFRGKVQVEWWVGMPVPEIERRIARLPPDTVVVYTAIYRDNAGGSYVPVLVLDRLARHANAPIFGSFVHYIDHGAIGDGRYDLGAIGALAGELAVRLLRGEPADSIGIMPTPAVPFSFDARQLSRWRIKRSQLPPGSVLLHEEPSLWSQYRWWIILALAVIIAQAVGLAAFISQRLARRKAERASAESLNLLSTISDSLEEGIATIDDRGTVTSVNRAWRNLAATHPEVAPAGANAMGIIQRAALAGNPDALAARESLQGVLSGTAESARFDFSPDAAESTRFEVRAVALQRPYRGAIVTVQDITDRWKSEERVRVALESAPVATFLVNLQSGIELVNGEAVRLFDYTREELLGRTITDLVPRFRRLSRVRDTGPLRDPAVPSADPVVTGIRKDGMEIPLQLHQRMIAMSSGPRMLVSMLDLSERRRHDAELQRHREETAHFGRVAVVGELSAAIAHELNQPLTGIMTNCQAAQRVLEQQGFSKEDLLDTFGDIVADARRAGEVIQRLRLMLRKVPTEIRPLDLNETVKQVQRLVGHDLALRGSALDLELAEELPRVAADRVHMQQVIMNLILNGADAMATVPLETRRVVLRTRPGMNHTVELEVRDSGAGISQEAMSHMFQPFFTTKPNGMGMGLSIVRSIVEFHGGRISCANAASGGAIFTVSLPATESEAVA